MEDKRTSEFWKEDVTALMGKYKKAANLLYLMVKDSNLYDCNKRTAAIRFLKGVMPPEGGITRETPTGRAVGAF